MSDSAEDCCLSDEEWSAMAPLISMNLDGTKFEERGSRLDRIVVTTWMTATEAERRAVHEVICCGSDNDKDVKLLKKLMLRIEQAVDDANLN